MGRHVQAAKLICLGGIQPGMFDNSMSIIILSSRAFKTYFVSVVVDIKEDG